MKKKIKQELKKHFLLGIQDYLAKNQSNYLKKFLILKNP